MTCLLDTHVLLFWLFNDRRLSAVARGILADPANRVLVSSVSAWEICTKHRLGKLPGADVLVADVAGWVARAGFEPLAVSIPHAQRAGTWPHPHRDPFDRMLAAQSAIEGIPLVSSDAALRAFAITLVW